MVVCFSVTNLQLGGAQVFVTRLASELARSTGWKVLIYDHQPHLRFKPMLEQLHPGVKIISYAENKTLQWLSWKINALLKTFNKKKEFVAELNKFSFKSCVIRHQFDIINSHMSGSDFIISSVVLPGRCKIVLTLHGEYELIMQDNDPSLNNKIRTSLNSASEIIYTADKNMAAIQSLLPEKNISSRKINVGFDPTAFNVRAIHRETLEIGQDDFIVGMIGRGILQKGWKIAIEAVLANNRRNSRKAVLICIGEGDDLESLFLEHKEPEIKRLRFRENFQDYYSAYQLFDLFVLPTYFAGESFPNVVIESLSWNVPVLATCWAEIPLMLRIDSDSPAGCCVPVSENTTTDFTQTLEKLIDDPVELLRLAEGCAKAAEAFNLRTILDQYLEVFHEAS